MNPPKNLLLDSFVSFPMGLATPFINTPFRNFKSLKFFHGIFHYLSFSVGSKCRFCHQNRNQERQVPALKNIAARRQTRTTGQRKRYNDSIKTPKVMTKPSKLISHRLQSKRRKSRYLLLLICASLLQIRFLLMFPRN